MDLLICGEVFIGNRVLFTDFRFAEGYTLADSFPFDVEGLFTGVTVGTSFWIGLLFIFFWGVFFGVDGGLVGWVRTVSFELDVVLWRVAINAIAESWWFVDSVSMAPADALLVLMDGLIDGCGGLLSVRFESTLEMS